MTESQTPYATDADPLSQLTAALYAVRRQKSALEKQEKALLADIRPLIDPQFDKLSKDKQPDAPDPSLACGGFQITRGEGINRTILADLLLERGVAAEIVAYATRSTPYFKYLVKERYSDKPDRAGRPSKQGVL
jgi:hypothetical protein